MNKVVIITTESPLHYGYFLFSFLGCFLLLFVCLLLFCLFVFLQCLNVAPPPPSPPSLPSSTFSVFTETVDDDQLNEIGWDRVTRSVRNGITYWVEKD